jgi:FMN-dependent NADH-azoreductase
LSRINPAWKLKPSWYLVAKEDKTIKPYAEDLPTPPSRFDHQKSYFEFWLPFIGVREVMTLVVESTSWGGQEKGKYSVERGKEAAKDLAAHF